MGNKYFYKDHEFYYEQRFQEGYEEIFFNEICMTVITTFDVFYHEIQELQQVQDAQRLRKVQDAQAEIWGKEAPKQVIKIKKQKLSS